MKKFLYMSLLVLNIYADPCPVLKPGMDVSGQTIMNCDYSNKDLSGVDFTGTEMNSVNFSGTKLEKAIFNDIKDAQYVKFVKADMKNAQIKGSLFKYSDFSYADLRGVDMRPLQVGSGFLSTNLAENNIFFGVATDATTNVNQVYLPMGFYVATGGNYSGIPYFYFG